MPYFYVRLYKAYIFLTNLVTSLVYTKFEKLYFCEAEIDFI